MAKRSVYDFSAVSIAGRKADFAAQRGKVSLHRQAGCQIDRIGIAQVDEGFAGGQRYRPERNPVVAGAHRAVYGIESNVKVLRTHLCHRVLELNAGGSFEALGRLAANVDLQHGAASGCLRAAVFGVHRQ